MNHQEDRTPRSPADGEPLYHTVLDVGTERIARVYADALLRAVEKHHQADAVLEDLEALVHQVFRTQPQFETFLTSGAIGRHRKTDLIQSIFTGRASEPVVNFLLVLNDHERLDLLRPIVKAFRELSDQRSGRIRVQVQSAVPLTDEEQERLRQQIRETFHKEPVLETGVDAELLGGLVVRVGDWLYDHSVRTQLVSLRKEILARSSHEIQSRRDRFCSADGN